MIQEKALTFAKELNAENLRTSYDWLRRCDGWLLFEEWVKEMNKKIVSEGRMAALVINNWELKIDRVVFRSTEYNF